MKQSIQFLGEAVSLEFTKVEANIDGMRRKYSVVLYLA